MHTCQHFSKRLRASAGLFFLLVSAIPSAQQFQQPNPPIELYLEVSTAFTNDPDSRGIRQLIFSANSDEVISLFHSGAVLVIDAKTLKRIKSISSQDLRRCAISNAANGIDIVIGDFTGNISKWNPTTNEVSHFYRYGNQEVIVVSEDPMTGRTRNSLLIGESNRDIKLHYG